MCGRFTLTRSAADVAAHFGLDLGPDDLDGLDDAEALAPVTTRYNLAPTQQVLTLRWRSDGHPALGLRSWGLVPSWADDPSDAARRINARSETAATKPAFRDAMRRRRCLVPADGFYEWAGPRGKRIPRHIRLPDGGLFAMAGLYESWEGPGGRVHRSCTILTTRANASVSEIHDRMPVIVDPGSYPTWLSRDNRDGAAALDAIACETAEQLELHVASGRVNDVAHDAPDCLVVDPEPQLSLF